MSLFDMNLNIVLACSVVASTHISRLEKRTIQYHFSGNYQEQNFHKTVLNVIFAFLLAKLQKSDTYNIM